MLFARVSDLDVGREALDWDLVIEPAAAIRVLVGTLSRIWRHQVVRVGTDAGRWRFLLLSGVQRFDLQDVACLDADWKLWLLVLRLEANPVRCVENVVERRCLLLLALLEPNEVISYWFETFLARYFDIGRSRWLDSAVQQVLALDEAALLNSTVGLLYGRLGGASALWEGA